MDGDPWSCTDVMQLEGGPRSVPLLVTRSLKGASSVSHL